MSVDPIDLFWKVCGASGPLVIEVEHRAAGTVTRHEIFHPYAIFGRDGQCDVRLDHPEVSRRHAYIQVIDGKLHCTDLGSRTGTVWNREAQTAGWIQSGKSIRIGPYRVRVYLSANDSEYSANDGPGPFNPLTTNLSGAALPAVSLEFPRKTSAVVPWKMNRVLALAGRSEACKIKLEDPHVAKFQCAFIRTLIGLWVVDLCGTGKVRLNGTRIICARVNEGDELILASHCIRPHYETPLSRIELGGETPARIVVQYRRKPKNETSKPESETEPKVPALASPRNIKTLDCPLPFTSAEVRTALAAQPVEKVEMVEAVVQPLIQQFTNMQAQMFDQFHQAMLSMFQLFGDLQRDQREQVRREMDELRKLTEEIQRLQNDPAVKARSGARAMIAGPAPVPNGANRINGSSTPPYPSLPGGFSSPSAGGRSTPVPQAPGFKFPSEERNDPIKPSDVPGEEAHADLFLKLASLQQEHQTRWQKILSMLSGNR